MANTGFSPIFKIILNVLGGLILAIGLITGISLLFGSGSVQNALMPLQFVGDGAIVNLISPYLSSLLSTLGIATLVISLALSLLLFALGQLLGNIISLESRLARLETAAPGVD